MAPPFSLQIKGALVVTYFNRLQVMGSFFIQMDDIFVCRCIIDFLGSVPPSACIYVGRRNITLEGDCRDSKKGKIF
jgi:hypothetical protein